MKHDKALQIAESVKALLSPHCWKIDIAGSLRRQRKEVGDIEICAQPKYTTKKNLFGGSNGIIIDDEFQNNVRQLGDVIKGKPNGRYMQIRLPQGINLDLFMPQENDYIRQLIIRTGSADFIRTYIAAGWVKLGWVGTERGLRKREDCQKVSVGEDKYVWKIVNDNGERPPLFETEKSFFQWLGIEYVPPEKREI